jgi:four helix bundle protein
MASADLPDMPRDHRKLAAFTLADDLALIVYESSNGFPTSERFGLQAQLRRAAVSIPTNIVEGCGRESERDFLRFLDIAFGSCREVAYLGSLSTRLGFIDTESSDRIDALSGRTAAAIAKLRQALRAT